MAEAKRMRKKNRQLKVTIDIPDQFEDDTGFMEALQDTLDAKSEDGGWCIRIDDDPNPHSPGEVDVTIRSISLGDVLIEPADDEPDDEED